MSRTAIIVGASAGIGLGIAEGLVSAGYRVALVGRRAERLSAAADLLDPSGEQVLQIVADARSQDGCERVVSETLARYGTIDVLCLNAGVYPGALLEQVSEEHLQSMFQTNLFGQIYMIQAAQQALTSSGTGRIVLTSSITGPLTGMPGYSVYGSSKAAQLGLMRGLALELAPAGITVNAILPGKVAVERTDAQDPAYVERVLRGIPIGRLGEPSDIAHAVTYFASAEASFVTGQALVIDGGQTLPEVLSDGATGFSLKGE